MNPPQSCQNFQEDSYTYTKWLFNNFHEEVNTNPFKQEYEDDINVVHEYDPYDYLIPNIADEEHPEDYYENGMFDEPPNINHYNEEEDESYTSYDYAQQLY